MIIQRRGFAHLAVLSKYALKRAKLNSVKSGSLWRKIASSLMFLIGGNIVYVFGYQDRRHTEYFDSYKLAEKKIREFELYSCKEYNIWEWIRYNYLTDQIHKVSISSGFKIQCSQLVQNLKLQGKIEEKDEYYKKIFIEQAMKCGIHSMGKIGNSKRIVLSSIVPVQELVIYKAPFLMDKEEFEIRGISEDEAKIELEQHSLDSMEQFIQNRNNLKFYQSPYHPLIMFNLDDKRSIFKQLVNESALIPLGIQIKITYRKRVEWIEILTGVTELFIE
jgi:hypothetical protein